MSEFIVEYKFEVLSKVSHGNLWSYQTIVLNVEEWDVMVSIKEDIHTKIKHQITTSVASVEDWDFWYSYEIIKVGVKL